MNKIETRADVLARAIDGASVATVAANDFRQHLTVIEIATTLDGVAVAGTDGVILAVCELAGATYEGELKFTLPPDEIKRLATQLKTHDEELMTIRATDDGEGVLFIAPTGHAYRATVSPYKLPAYSQLFEQFAPTDDAPTARAFSVELLGRLVKVAGKKIGKLTPSPITLCQTSGRSGSETNPMLATFTDARANSWRVLLMPTRP